MGSAEGAPTSTAASGANPSGRARAGPEAHRSRSGPPVISPGRDGARATRRPRVGLHAATSLERPATLSNRSQGGHGRSSAGPPFESGPRPGPSRARARIFPVPDQNPSRLEEPRFGAELNLRNLLKIHDGATDPVPPRQA